MAEKCGVHVRGPVSDVLSRPGFDLQQLDPKLRLQIALLQHAELSRNTADEIPLEIMTSGTPSCLVRYPTPAHKDTLDTTLRVPQGKRRAGQWPSGRSGRSTAIVHLSPILCL